jgi:hypothetical protein
MAIVACGLKLTLTDVDPTVILVGEDHALKVRVTAPVQRAR